MSSQNCPLGGRCCQGESEIFWLNDPQKLFCSYSPIPHGNLASGERLNALTRFVIYLSIIMLCTGYKHARGFFILGVMFIVLIYITSSKNEKEGYAVVKEIGLDGIYQNKQMNGIPLPQNYSSNLKLSKELTNLANEDLIPVYEPNENSFMGAGDEYLKATSFDFEGGSRDVEADIQYYSPKTGVNRRTMINPVIPPRIFDHDQFGKESTQISKTHTSRITDLTDDLDLGNNHGLVMDDPYKLGNPYKLNRRVPNGVTMMNRIGDTGNSRTGLQDDGGYTAGQFMDRYPDSRDFAKNYPHLNPEENPDSIKEASKSYEGGQLSQTKNTPDNIVPIERPKKASSQGQTVKEGFDFVNLNESEVINENFGGLGNNVNTLDISYNKFNRARPNTTVVNDQLLQESPTYVYNNSYFQQPERRVFLNEIQPSLYSYSMNQEPINSNIGISYNPQPAPVYLDQVNNNGVNMPLYSRIDPQLVRSDGTSGQINSQPLRTEWSANYSNYIAPEGSVNFEDIYDPRFNSYGDSYRSYADVNLGQTKYYYSDVDAYRQPNFISRSNVEFTEYRTPQNDVWPEYNRTVSLDDMRVRAENQTTADELFHREDMMSHKMAKINRESWSQRFAPLRKTNNSSIGPF